MTSFLSFLLDRFRGSVSEVSEEEFRSLACRRTLPIEAGDVTRLAASSMLLFSVPGADIRPSAALCCSLYTLWKKDGSVDFVSRVSAVLGPPSTVGVVSPGRRKLAVFFTGLKSSSESSESNISPLGAILAGISTF
jgi:hypothetical protein